MQFRKTFNVGSGGIFPSAVQPGQWVKVGKERKCSRFVGYVPGGVVLVRPRGKGMARRISVEAFRLARNKTKENVLGVL